MLVAASFYMKPVVYAQFILQVPHHSWFKTQRKGLGYEAWLYAMVRVAKCECCLQWGFDETSIDGVPIGRYANWEATLEPVHLDAKGNPFVGDDDVVTGPNGKTIFPLALSKLQT
jgi:hypothetical protein